MSAGIALAITCVLLAVLADVAAWRRCRGLSYSSPTPLGQSRRGDARYRAVRDGDRR